MIYSVQAEFKVEHTQNLKNPGSSRLLDNGRNTSTKSFRLRVEINVGGLFLESWTSDSKYEDKIRKIIWFCNNQATNKIRMIFILGG
jgi:hypothetical protein